MACFSLLMPLVVLALPPNHSSVIDSGGFPHRVHVFEDYETDIEKRWWLRGKPETRNTPTGKGRSCRGVPSKDFDRKMGDQSAMYTAVVFNPVPGPPMGKRPRLSFRYRLNGTDAIRVQIYSLTRNYHRFLTLTGLKQKQWQSATVDMRAARRPDGSGGPLSENERIDDIQFYVDRRAELLIDDIILFDGAAKKEKRLFPKRILFTGWFDTGKQGKEWPGNFEIEKEGYFWKAARAVSGSGGRKQLRISLRGRRPLGKSTKLFFRYRSEGVKTVAIGAGGSKLDAIVKVGETKKWQERTVDLSRLLAGKRFVEEIVFTIPRSGDLWVDDLLLFEE